VLTLKFIDKLRSIEIVHKYTKTHGCLCSSSNIIVELRYKII